MDTLEHRRTYQGGFNWEYSAPILWKGKSAKDIQRQEYPDYRITQKQDPPSSTRNGVEYCRQFTVRRHGENVNHRTEVGDTVATLIEIDK